MIVQGTQIIENFEVWRESQYDAIMGMSMLNDVTRGLLANAKRFMANLPATNLSKSKVRELYLQYLYRPQ